MTDILYAGKAASASTSDLYTLDPLTAAPSSLGASGHALTSLAFDPTDGTLYATSSAASGSQPDSLLIIDPLTGAATLVGAMGGTVSDIAFDATGQMWGWTRRTSNGGLGGANAALLQINKATAGFAVIGSSGLNMQGGGISFHSNGTLYGLLATGAVAHLYTINTSTGAITDLGGLTPSLGIANSASFDSADSLWMLLGGAGGTTSLKTVNVGALTVATIGNPGVNFDALAWSATPAGDIIPPSLVSIAASVATVTLTYDEPLAGSPLTSEFAVTSNGSPVTVTDVAIAGSTVLLTLASPVFVGDTVLVSYTA